MLLVAGGETDPNVRRLVEAATAEHQRCITLIVGRNQHPRLTWDLSVDRLELNGKRIRPRAAFIRHDVFGHMDDGRNETAFRAHAWYSTVVAYVDSHPEVRSFNREHDGGATKPHQLHLARRVGLEVPWTLISNDLPRIRRAARARSLVVKPVNGGEYCQGLSEVIDGTPSKAGAGAAPAIVQEELVHPDVRIYRIGTQYLAFEIESRVLDYRTTSDVRVRNIPLPAPAIVRSLGRLTDALGLDFAAADFKADRKTGKLLFLEVNSAPMFVAFDAASNGSLCRAILADLRGR